jgi:hypothetical protein
MMMQYWWLFVLWTCPSSSVLKRIMIRKHHLLWVKVKAKAYGGIETWLLSFLTPLDRGERSAPCPVALLHLKATPVSLKRKEALWAPELVWTRRGKDRFLVPAGNRAALPWLYSP